MFFIEKRTNLEKIFHQAFPDELSEDVSVAINTLTVQSTHPRTKDFILNGKTLTTPIRVWFEEINSEKFEKLSKKQQEILCCIFTRHSDGYIREKYVKYLLNNSEEYFVIPYIYSLIGEHVVEILEAILTNLKVQHLNLIKRFKKENALECNKINSRVISYWDAYYRYPNSENTLP